MSRLWGSIREVGSLALWSGYMIYEAGVDLLSITYNRLKNYRISYMKEKDLFIPTIYLPSGRDDHRALPLLNLIYKEKERTGPTGNTLANTSRKSPRN
ncbi:MAG: hypothetical protein AABY00_00785 [Nanoarchaeota archaeon]